MRLCMYGDDKGCSTSDPNGDICRTKNKDAKQTCKGLLLASSLEISPSKFTTIWWGSREVMLPRFAGVKVADYVDPTKSPVSLDGVAVSDRLLYAHGVRDMMLFAALAEKAGATTTFEYKDETYPRDRLVTPSVLQVFDLYLDLRQDDMDAVFEQAVRVALTVDKVRVLVDGKRGCRRVMARTGTGTGHGTG